MQRGDPMKKWKIKVVRFCSNFHKFLGKVQMINFSRKIKHFYPKIFQQAQITLLVESRLCPFCWILMQFWVVFWLISISRLLSFSTVVWLYYQLCSSQRKNQSKQCQNLYSCQFHILNHQHTQYPSHSLHNPGGMGMRGCNNSNHLHLHHNLR